MHGLRGRGVRGVRGRRGGRAARLHVRAGEKDAGGKRDHDHVVRHRVEVVEPDAVECLARQVDRNEHVLPGRTRAARSATAHRTLCAMPSSLLLSVLSRAHKRQWPAQCKAQTASKQLPAAAVGYASMATQSQ